MTKDAIRRHVGKVVTVTLAGREPLRGMLTRDVLSRQFTLVGVRDDGTPDSTRITTFWPADAVAIIADAAGSSEGA